MRILLADDDAKIAKHVKQALVAEGYATDIAADGEEAIWLAENNPYDLLMEASSKGRISNTQRTKKGSP
jgi:two-component system OmpR family response regulator